jgi:lipid-binding SYLF domain-containing protein
MAMKLRNLLVLLAALVLVVSGVTHAGAAVSKKDAEKARSEIKKMANETLARLYRAQPSAKSAVANAAGYAVFSNFGMKIMFMGSGTGSGLAVSKGTNKTTYMKMIEVQAGLGFGVKKFRLVWVFENKSDLDRFINSGWELGGQGSAGAKLGGQGAAFQGAMSIAPGVWLYQLSDDGLSLELTAKGTKYYKNDDLN